MLLHPTLATLQTLRLSGMYRALEEQLRVPEFQTLSFEERLGLLLDREVTERANRRLHTRLKNARLRQAACLEDIDYRPARGLDKVLLAPLSACHWVRDHLNLLITGPCGVGKTYLACALAQQACREGYTARYLRLPRLLQELTFAKGDGRYGKLLTDFAKTDVLVLDDWGLAPLTADQRRDLLELIEDRHNSRSTVVTSQLPVAHWHDYLGDPTLADAILDRLVHNAYKLTLTGDSMRKITAKLTALADSE
jgi:DNA replication protein DnaC